MPVWPLLLLISPFISALTTTDVSKCSCGYYDAAAGHLFTDSAIVYFNETDELPQDVFSVNHYEHRYDRGWNALYRDGADPSNTAIGRDSTGQNLQTMELYCNTTTSEHLVIGGGVTTKRQDIFFGSFRTRMRAPRHWAGGSSLTFNLHHNQTESVDLNVMNTNNESTAWISTLVRGEFPDIDLGYNFTKLIDNGTNPWDYTEYRLDWSRHRIDYYIGGDLVRTLTTKQNGTLPSTPTPFRIKHWSVGNKYSMQGPPYLRSVANVAWVRMFFNSSLATHENKTAFDQRCNINDACLMDDMTLRGSTAYPHEATHEWKQHNPDLAHRWVPIMIDSAFGALSFALLLNTFRRRASWAKVKSKLGFGEKKHDFPYDVSEQSRDSYSASPSGIDTPVSGNAWTTDASGRATPLPPYLRDQASNLDLRTPPLYSGRHTPVSGIQTPVSNPERSTSAFLPLRPTFQGLGASANARSSGDSEMKINPIREQRDENVMNQESDNRTNSSSLEGSRRDTVSSPGPFVSNPFLPTTPLPTTPAPEALPENPIATSAPEVEPAVESKEEKRPVENKTVEKKPVVPAPPKRVDYLAGLVSISAILVTVTHFNLTFWGAIGSPTVQPHYIGEVWVRQTVGSLLFDPLWIGPFLMISTRFLISNYLRTGKLDNMAQKIVVRPFRLLIPVVFIALLEYLLMDSGAVSWLEYLPSVTWSSWPFTSVPTNFGTFMSELLQLAYLIPNAAPQITYNYCVGVLWTIPVQLQGAWTTLIAVLMIREIKTPWKRFGFYAFCILQHWYAVSWGSFYYAGVALADLDLTYKYTKWLHARPFVYYPFLLFVIGMALSGFILDTVSSWTHVQYSMYENSWHPDTATGKAQVQVGIMVYPDYFVPRLPAWSSTVFMQMLADISPAVQKVLSAKILQLVFPHIFTIYLLHGFVFWSVGSWLCIKLFEMHVPYWLDVCICGVVCYAVLIGSLYILTPVIELIGKNFSASIWGNASEEPAPKRPTMYPFGPDLFEKRADLTETVCDDEATRQMVIEDTEKKGMFVSHPKEGKKD